MRRPTALLAAASFAFASAAWAQTPSGAPATDEAAPESEFTPWTNGQPQPGAAPSRTTSSAPVAPSQNGVTKPASAQSTAPAQTVAPGSQGSSPDEWSTPAGTAAPSTSAPQDPTGTSAPAPSTPPVMPGPDASAPSNASPTSQRAPVESQTSGVDANVARRPEPQFNRVSIYGAPTLGQWNRGLGAYLGFPLLGIKAGIGLLDHLDAGLGFDSFYGVMNEPRLWAKYNLANGPNWSVSFQLEAGAAFFTQRPEAEGKGARWLTGRRNYNVEPGIIVSYRGDSVQSARLFLDARYAAAFDTQPYTKDPLGGVPPTVVWGHNVPIRMGAEMPFSPSTSFLFVFGFDIHGRPEDAVFMPVVSVGLVTGI